MGKKTGKRTSGPTRAGRTEAEREEQKNDLALGILEHGNTTKAAKALGLPPRTARTWAAEPGFQERFCRIARQRFDRVFPTMAVETRRAMIELGKLSRDESIPPIDRANIAERVVRLGMQGMELYSLDRRVEALAIEVNVDTPANDRRATIKQLDKAPDWP